ncbi:hypothetical protein [Xanthomonas sp. D-109]|uniref:hypothetical protein n=1 Tax=Xanthomonas sp. D-109 TaxID=2821274 RepID=UPI001ADA21C2|nr:hypothetical protein [Xanthomonas sp. D-109]MBO9880025.1 hypothetical protein [Xanthomonas sp. D-109]
MTAASLLAIAGGVLTLGAISPGASFLRVARLAAARSRASGFAAALGTFSAVLMSGLGPRLLWRAGERRHAGCEEGAVRRGG